MISSCIPNHDKNLLTKVQHLPSLELLSVDSSTILNPIDTKTGSPIILFYFRADCPHCENELNYLLNNKVFNNVEIYLISNDEIGNIQSFYINHQLSKFKKIHTVKDHKHSFVRIFKPTFVPFFAMYDSSKKLIRIYTGEGSMASINKSIFTKLI